MTSAETLLSLAERVEKAEGPDRIVDCLIYMALNSIPSVCGKRLVEEDESPAYTASLDAAMTLVPEGWQFEVCGFTARAGGYTGSAMLIAEDEQHRAHGKTPALALTAAALRARAAT